MTQPLLFGEQPSPPIHRAADPPTSAESAGKVVGELPTLQDAMLDAFNVPSTSNEAAQHCRIKHGKKHHAESYRKRTHELERKGLIEKIGARPCLYTGSNAEVFERVNK